MSSAARWRTLLAEVDQAGLCAQPVRLRGLALDRATGALSEGDLLVACKDRRAAVCPSCSRLYQADAWQLVAAGIRGGKGVPLGVTAHPQLFVTLTAPSFGPVHRGGESNGRIQPCRPRRSGGLCPHGRPLSCTLRHGAGDPHVGDPLCSECFDYRGAVLWNAHISRLWTRTTNRLYREVARVAGLSEARARALARLSYLKVVEFQARGSVHLHVVLRADGGAGPAEGPPLWLDAAALREAIAKAHEAVAIPLPPVAGTTLRRARWGTQHDVRVLVAEDDADATAIAAYVAKYATKTADGTAWLAHRIRSRAQLERLGARPHVVALARTAWILAARKDLARLHLREHAHTLGYGGQFSSKSVAFSTTFGALRRARADYVHGDDAVDFDYDGEWRYVGRGYGDPAADDLAAALRDVSLSATRRLPGGSQKTSRTTSQTL